MVLILVLITVLGCIAVQWTLQRKAARKAAESLAHEETERFLPSLAGQEALRGLFLHNGHTWARLDPSGAVQVGLDGFARGILGKVDRFELPAEGTTLRQGAPAFTALQAGKKIEFVSPVDGVVCAVNRPINEDLQAAKKEPYGKGWTFAVRPSDFTRNLKKLRPGAEASEWLAREASSFSEFLVLHRAIPQELGATLADGGAHVEGIMESMDGEILEIAIRKYFR
jgi:glycine cleavage system H lipoate-binding protein